MSTPAAAQQQRESGNRRYRSKYPRDKAGHIHLDHVSSFLIREGHLAVKKEHNPKQVHQAKGSSTDGRSALLSGACHAPVLLCSRLEWAEGGSHATTQKVALSGYCLGRIFLRFDSTQSPLHSAGNLSPRKNASARKMSTKETAYRAAEKLRTGQERRTSGAKARRVLNHLRHD